MSTVISTDSLLRVAEAYFSKDSREDDTFVFPSMYNYGNKKQFYLLVFFTIFLVYVFYVFFYFLNVYITYYYETAEWPKLIFHSGSVSGYFRGWSL